jgi:thymidylate kinase
MRGRHGHLKYGHRWSRFPLFPMSASSSDSGNAPEESTGAAIRALLSHFDLNRVRYRPAPPHPLHAGELSLAIHPADFSRSKRMCGALEEVKLLRTLGVSSEFQVILQDSEGARGKYCAVRIRPELHPLRTSWKNRCSEALRGSLRWLRPNGLFCVVLGPDGVGKSTTIEHLQRELQILFGPCRKQRWRPGVIRKVKPDSTNRMPHAKVLRGRFTSALALLGFALDFGIGYEFWARPAMARSETILFDRYFHDILIDPKRYRYAGPMWLPRLIAKIIPPHDALFIILDAADEVILSRKQELSASELRRQRAAYAIFGAQARNAMVIRTERPVDEIVAEIVEKIVGILAWRNTRHAANTSARELGPPHPSVSSVSYPEAPVPSTHRQAGG